MLPIRFFLILFFVPAFADNSSPQKASPGAAIPLVVKKNPQESYLFLEFKGGGCYYERWENYYRFSPEIGCVDRDGQLLSLGPGDSWPYSNN